MIRAHAVSKRYGSSSVLAGVEFEIGAHEKVALVGVNGAGKTTLFRCLLGLVPFEGELTVEGEPAGVGGRAARSRLAYVPQTPPVFDLTLAAFIDLFAALRRADREPIATRLEALGLPLPEHGAKRMRTLSGGMLQKAYLALALGTAAPVLLLDEPTASLDPASRAGFLSDLRAIGEDTCTILATHRIEEIRALTERLLVLDRGRIVFDGTFSELLDMARVPTRLWVEAPDVDRGAVAAGLRDHPLVVDAKPNGRGLHITARDEHHLDVLRHLADLALPIAGFQIEAPGLDEILDRFRHADRDTGA